MLLLSYLSKCGHTCIIFIIIKMKLSYVAWTSVKWISTTVLAMLFVICDYIMIGWNQTDTS